MNTGTKMDPLEVSVPSEKSDLPPSDISNEPNNPRAYSVPLSQSGYGNKRQDARPYESISVNLFEKPYKDMSAFLKQKLNIHPRFSASQ